MTTELDIKIAELEAKLEELREQGEDGNYEGWNVLQAELEHLKEQKIVIQQLRS